MSRRLALRRSSRRETTKPECILQLIKDYIPVLQAEPRAHEDVLDNATPAVAYAAPDPVTDCVASSPAVTYAAPAPLTEYVASESAAAYAAPTPVSDYVALSPAASVTRAEAAVEISGVDGGCDFPAEVPPTVEAVVPESTDVTERWGDADMPESTMEMSEDAAEPSQPEAGPVAGEAQPEEVVAEVVFSAEADGNRDGTQSWSASCS